MTPFPDLLRERRKAASKTQRHLAHAIGWGESRISDLERGREHPPRNAAILAEMANVLGCSSDELCIAAGVLPLDMAHALPEVVELWRARR